MIQKKSKKRVTLEDLAGMVARGFESVHTDIAELKNDVTILKQDVSVLKQDVSGLKQDVVVLKDDVAELKNEVAAINDRFVPWYAFDTLVHRVDIIEGRGN